MYRPMSQGRTKLATLIALVLTIALVPLFALPASAGHIPATGTIPANCEKLDKINKKVGKSNTVVTIDGVSFTVYEWIQKPGSKNDYIGFSYSAITGLSGQQVDYLIKGGGEVMEGTLDPNGGSVTFNGIGAISHVTFCLFSFGAGSTDPGSTDPGSTDPGSTAETTDPGSIAGSTAETTDPGSTPTAGPTGSAVTLPYTGSDTIELSVLALMGLAGGALLLLVARRTDAKQY